MTQLFGTDGIRGTAGTYPLDVETVRRVGAALVRALPHENAKLLIGRDTRESGVWIERELAHGARSAGASVQSIGVGPTPAVAYLTGSLDFDAGVVISASHNPFQDNGIKVFSGAGRQIRRTVREPNRDARRGLVVAGARGRRADVTHADHLRKYLDHARTVLPNLDKLGRVRLAVDCANGAMTTVAPALFAELGFDLTVLGAEPDGRNINKDVGSTHPDRLADVVKRGGYRLGVAFDGDGDRAILVDGTGRVLDGDHVMLMCARQMQAEEQAAWQRGRRHGHEQHRSGNRAEESRHRAGPHQSRRQIRHGGNAEARVCLSGRAVRTSDFLASTSSPATV